MTRQAIPLLLLVSLALAPLSVRAKDPTPDEARRVSTEYASCIVKHNHDKASEALLADVDNDTLQRKFRGLIDNTCLPSDADSLKFAGDLYRYALADALVAAEFADSGPDDFSDRLPLSHLPSPTQAELDAALAKAGSAKKRDQVLTGFQKKEGVSLLSRYGECVARQDPRDVRLWLLTKPGTPEENGRIDALRPTFAACLEGGTVAFSKATMRGTVALNYYRLAHAATRPSTISAN